jgi:hypothetical protein
VDGLSNRHLLHPLPVASLPDRPGEVRKRVSAAQGSFRMQRRILYSERLYPFGTGGGERVELASKLKQRQATQNRRLVAFQHPMRIAIFHVVAERAASIGEIAKYLGLGRDELGNIRHHLLKLVQLGCVEPMGDRVVNRRVVTVYKAIDRPLVETDEWDQLNKENPMLAETLLGEFMQVQLRRYTEAFKAGTLGNDAEFHVSHTPMVLDGQAVQEVMESLEGCRLRASEKEKGAAMRRREDGADAVHASLCISFFKTPGPA